MLAVRQGYEFALNVFVNFKKFGISSSHWFRVGLGWTSESCARALDVMRWFFARVLADMIAGTALTRDKYPIELVISIS